MKSVVRLGPVPSFALFALLGSIAGCAGDDTGTGPGDAAADAGRSDAEGDAALTNPFGDDVPISGTEEITGLVGPVDVIRDKYGMVHIYANTAVDAFRVEGFQVARDRTVQLELLRRTAIGSMAEVLGDSAIDQDIATRAVGMRRVGQRIYDTLPPGGPVRAYLDAYADGVNQLNARIVSGKEKLPAGMVGITIDVSRPWTGADILAVTRLQAYTLSYTVGDEIAATSFAEAARAKFNRRATDPALAGRAGFLIDTCRFDSPYPTTVLPRFPDDPALTGRVDPAALAALEPFRDAMTKTRSFFGAPGSVGSNNWVVGPELTSTGHTMIANDPHFVLGAPAVFWMVHIRVVHHDPKERLNVAGVAFPGIPGIILGFNEHVAWGATDAYYDVSDVYQEKVTPDGTGVVFQGKSVPFQTAKEIIPLKGGRSYEYDVQIVPHHGAILPTIDPATHTVTPASGTALSARWTGDEPTHDIDFIFQTMRATNVEDVRVALRSYATGAENWVVGDDQGNVFYSSQAHIPVRDKRAFTWDPATFTGTLPFFVLPGDGTAEWTGYLEERYVPHVKNPRSHFVATANNQQVPRPVPNDPSSLVLPNGAPIFLGAEYDIGARASRITDRLSAMATSGHAMTLDDMAILQGDKRSMFAAALVPPLLTALQHAAEEQQTPGSYPDLSAIVTDPRFKAEVIGDVRATLTSWRDQADYDAASGIDPDTNQIADDPKQASEATAIFSVWLARVAGAIFADELGAIGQSSFPATGVIRAVIYLLTAPDPRKLATYASALGDSILFDDLATPGIGESRDQRIVLSMLDALDLLTARLGADRAKWRWGSLHTIRFDALIPLWGTLSIPPVGDPVFPNGFPRGGDGSTVDVAGFSIPADRTSLPRDQSFSYTFGPAQRLVVDLDPKGPVARNVIAGGNVWDSASKHFRDDADRWRKNENHPVPFAKRDVIDAAESHVVFSTK